MVTVPTTSMIGLERMSNYRGVGLQRFHSSTANIMFYIPGWLQLVRYCYTCTSPACIQCIYAISAEMLHEIQSTLHMYIQHCSIQLYNIMVCKAVQYVHMYIDYAFYTNI